MNLFFTLLTLALLLYQPLSAAAVAAQGDADLTPEKAQSIIEQCLKHPHDLLKTPQRQRKDGSKAEGQQTIKSFRQICDEAFGCNHGGKNPQKVLIFDSLFYVSAYANFFLRQESFGLKNAVQWLRRLANSVLTEKEGVDVSDFFLRDELVSPILTTYPKLAQKAFADFKLKKQEHGEKNLAAAAYVVWSDHYLERLGRIRTKADWRSEPYSLFFRAITSKIMPFNSETQPITRGKETDEIALKFRLLHQKGWLRNDDQYVWGIWLIKKETTIGPKSDSTEDLFFTQRSAIKLLSGFPSYYPHYKATQSAAKLMMITYQLGADGESISEFSPEFLKTVRQAILEDELNLATLIGLLQTYAYSTEKTHDLSKIPFDALRRYCQNSFVAVLLANLALDPRWHVKIDGSPLSESERFIYAYQFIHDWSPPERGSLMKSDITSVSIRSVCRARLHNKYYISENTSYLKAMILARYPALFDHKDFFPEHKTPEEKADDIRKIYPDTGPILEGLISLNIMGDKEKAAAHFKEAMDAGHRGAYDLYVQNALMPDELSDTDESENEDTSYKAAPADSRANSNVDTELRKKRTAEVEREEKERQEKALVLEAQERDLEKKEKKEAAARRRNLKKIFDEERVKAEKEDDKEQAPLLSQNNEIQWEVDYQEEGIKHYNDIMACENDAQKAEEKAISTGQLDENVARQRPIKSTELFRLWTLISSIQDGSTRGKPETLTDKRRETAVLMSRRFTEEDRLVYTVTTDSKSEK